MTLMYAKPEMELIVFMKAASDVITASSSSDVIEEDTGGYDWIGP